ncbi:MAG TPA: pectate lyase [Opitutus sp.]|nr:pectate lyase [Opitutus sp.]
MRVGAVLLLFLPLALSGAVGWSEIPRQDASWYATDEARAIADALLLYQTGSGGWPKNTDMSHPPSAEFLASTAADRRASTIDNGATTSPLHLLARVGSATSDPRHQSAVERGIDYLLAAQSPSGGWPQYYPRRDGYYSHITYNDDAMANVLELLRTVSRGEPPYQFIDDKRRANAASAIERGIRCILRTQIIQDGKLTVWCAQHDEATLAPAWARNFEPPSLSGHESVRLVRFLMMIEQPTPDIMAAIEGAVDWLRAHSISGLRLQTSVGPDGERERLTVSDPAAPPLWARFYELGTNRPIFLGRDRIVRYHHNEIERERRNGYGYLGTWPARLIERDYPAWKAQQASLRNAP